MILYPIGVTKSCAFAVTELMKGKFAITDHPSPDITHLLLDIPSFDSHGNLQGGRDIRSVLQMLPQNITVIGGRLQSEALDGYQKLDLLEDEAFLAANAAITADCALRVAGQYLTTTFRDSRILILGWGRIGKCLAGLLQAMGCSVTVAARKESDRAMLKALQFQAVDFSEAANIAGTFPLIFNTVPEMVLTAPVEKSVAIDLASKPGIEGNHVITARGLPGKIAPESAGRLIAQTIIRRLKL